METPAVAATAIPRYSICMTVKEIQERLVEDLLIIPDVQERLSIIVAQAARRSLPEADKVDVNLVKGCVSRVWLVTEVTDGRCHFRFDAESPMVKGLVGLLCDAYEGGAVEEVGSQEPIIWERLGLLKQLTPTRLNGLAAVRQAIRTAALRAIASPENPASLALE